MGVNYAAKGLTESIRADVGLIFFENYLEEDHSWLNIKTILG
jgi:hypothetical protein